MLMLLAPDFSEFIVYFREKSGFFGAVTILLLKLCAGKWPNLNMLIKWVKMNKKFRKLFKS